jgi:hypothetical protein
MKKLLVTFGDSWTFGSELDMPSNENWTAQVSKMLDVEHVNMSTPASSIGHLTVQLFEFLKQHRDSKLIFMVGLSGTTRYLSYSNGKNEFVNITPEAVYATRNIKSSGQPPEHLPYMGELAMYTYRLVEHVEYNRFLLTQVMFLFQNYCKLNDIDLIFFSYFDYLEPSDIVDKTYLYPMSITKALTGSEYSLPDIRENEYFEGKLFHPNTKGHTKIAEIIYEFYTKHYPRN